MTRFCWSCCDPVQLQPAQEFVYLVKVPSSKQPLPCEMSEGPGDRARRGLCRAGEEEMRQNEYVEQNNIVHFGVRAADGTADK